MYKQAYRFESHSKCSKLYLDFRFATCLSFLYGPHLHRN